MPCTEGVHETASQTLVCTLFARVQYMTQGHGQSRVFGNCGVLADTAAPGGG